MSKKVKKVLSTVTLGISDAILPSAPEMPESQVQTPDAAPTAVDEGALDAREAQRRRQLQLAGLGGNVLTGAGGLTAATTSGKTLLGS